MVLIGFCVDISSFLGELRAERDERQKHAKEILDWAMLGLRFAGHEMGTIFLKMATKHCRKHFRLIPGLLYQTEGFFPLLQHRLMTRSIYI